MGKPAPLDPRAGGLGRAWHLCVRAPPARCLHRNLLLAMPCTSVPRSPPFRTIDGYKTLGVQQHAIWREFIPRPLHGGNNSGENDELLPLTQALQTWRRLHKAAGNSPSSRTLRASDSRAHRLGEDLRPKMAVSRRNSLGRERTWPKSISLRGSPEKGPNSPWRGGEVFHQSQPLHPSLSHKHLVMSSCFDGSNASLSMSSSPST